MMCESMRIILFMLYSFAEGRTEKFVQFHFISKFALRKRYNKSCIKDALLPQESFS